MGQKWVKKVVFQKKTSQTIWGAQTSEMSPLVAQKQAILPSPDSQNALEMGCFGTKNQSKMDQKRCFSKDTFGLFGFHKQVDWSHFEPMLSNFGPSQGRKGLENGLICNHKWLKNGSDRGVVAAGAAGAAAATATAVAGTGCGALN